MKTKLLLIFVMISSFAYAKDNKRSGMFLDTDIQYLYSRVERLEVGGSNFALLSESGYRIGLELWGYANRWLSISIGGDYLTHTFEGPASRIINEPALNTTSVFGGFGIHIMKDVKIYLRYNQESVIVMEDENVQTHTLKLMTIPSATLGLNLMAQSQLGYQIEAEVYMSAGAGADTFNSEEVKMNYQAGGRSRLMFGENKRSFKYGFVVDLWLEEVMQGEKKILGSNAAFGLLTSMHF